LLGHVKLLSSYQSLAISRQLSAVSRKGRAADYRRLITDH